MRIEDFGQINPIDTIKAQRAETEVPDFESTLKKAFDEGDKEKLRKVCNEFEAVMLKMLFKQMKATIDESGLTEKSRAREIFEDEFDDLLMEQASERGMGISDMMYRQLSARMDKTYVSKPEADGAEPVEK